PELAEPGGGVRLGLARRGVGQDELAPLPQLLDVGRQAGASGALHQAVARSKRGAVDRVGIGLTRRVRRLGRALLRVGHLPLLDTASTLRGWVGAAAVDPRACRVGHYAPIARTS